MQAQEQVFMIRALPLSLQSAVGDLFVRHRDTAKKGKAVAISLIDHYSRDYLIRADKEQLKEL